MTHKNVFRNSKFMKEFEGKVKFKLSDIGHLMGQKINLSLEVIFGNKREVSNPIYDHKRQDNLRKCNFTKTGG